MLKENRLVGVEIEYTGKGNQNYWETKIRKIGEKFKINIETDYGRQHSMSDKVDFHLTYDGSVSGCGMELQSRPFYIQDKKFIADFTRLMLYVRALGAVFDLSCGLHIHVSGSDFSILNIKNLLVFYYKWEDVLWSIIHPARKHNSYCKSVRTKIKCSLESLKKATKVDALKAWVWGKNDRYTTLNLEPWFSHKHYEIRMCHGLLSPQRILSWANLQLHIAQYVKESVEEFNDVGFEENSVDSLEKMVKLIKFDEGLDFLKAQFKRFTEIQEYEEKY